VISSAVGSTAASRPVLSFFPVSAEPRSFGVVSEPLLPDDVATVAPSAAVAPPLAVAAASATRAADTAVAERAAATAPTAATTVATGAVATDASIPPSTAAAAPADEGGGASTTAKLEMLRQQLLASITQRSRAAHSRGGSGVSGDIPIVSALRGAVKRGVSPAAAGDEAAMKKSRREVTVTLAEDVEEGEIVMDEAMSVVPEDELVPVTSAATARAVHAVQAASASSTVRPSDDAAAAAGGASDQLMALRAKALQSLLMASRTTVPPTAATARAGGGPLASERSASPGAGKRQGAGAAAGATVVGTGASAASGAVAASVAQVAPVVAVTRRPPVRAIVGVGQRLAVKVTAGAAGPRAHARKAYADGVTAHPRDGDAASKGDGAAAAAAVAAGVAARVLETAAASAGAGAVGAADVTPPANAGTGNSAELRAIAEAGFAQEWSSAAYGCDGLGGAPDEALCGVGLWDGMVVTAGGAGGEEGATTGVVQARCRSLSLRRAVPPSSHMWSRASQALLAKSVSALEAAEKDLHAKEVVIYVCAPLSALLTPLSPPPLLRCAWSHRPFVVRDRTACVRVLCVCALPLQRP
jgi:hypothetical protein